MRGQFLAILACVCLWLAPAQGAMPSGPYTINFSTDEVQVFDFSGNYNYALPVFGGKLTFNFDVTHQWNGQITGNGTFLLEVFDGTGTGTMTMKGSYRRNEDNDVNQLILQYRDMDGAGTFDTVDKGPQSFPIIGAAVTQAAFDSVSNKLIGSTSGRVEIKKHAILDIDTGFLVPTAEQSGAVRVDLNIVPDANKLRGTATITLSNGRTLDYTIGGSYDPKTDLSKIYLTPVNKTDRRAKLQINGIGETLEINEVKGVLLGQKVRIRPPPPEPPADD